MPAKTRSSRPPKRDAWIDDLAVQIRRRAFLGWGVASLASPAVAATDSTLRMVFPFTAGSGVDASARGLAEALRVATGRRSFIDNKPGGSGVIGTQEVARAVPDGNTVLFTTGGHTTNAVLMRKLPYDPLNSFTPVTMVARGAGWVLAVGPKSAYRTLQQFLDAARKEPNKLTFGSAGTGGSTHVMGALFCKAAGIALTHIPYKGAPINDLIAGTIDSSFQSTTGVMEMLNTNRLRPLGVSSDQRVPQLPDVPTFREAGIHANLPAWSGVLAPARLPMDLAEALHRELSKAALVKSFQDLSRKSGNDIVMMPPTEFRAYIVQELETLRRILPPLGIQLD